MTNYNLIFLNSQLKDNLIKNLIIGFKIISGINFSTIPKVKIA